MDKVKEFFEQRPPALWQFVVFPSSIQGKENVPRIRKVKYGEYTVPYRKL
jgi:hypothetical protein